VFDYVKSNAEQIRTRFKNESYNSTGDYKITFFVNGLRAIITTWLDNDCIDPVEQMNEIVMRGYKALKVLVEKGLIENTIAIPMPEITVQIFIGLFCR